MNRLLVMFFLAGLWSSSVFAEEILEEEPWVFPDGTVYKPDVDTPVDDWDYEDLLDLVEEAIVETTDQGVIQEINLSRRSMLVGGFQYLVPPLAFEFPLDVQLYGTSAGSFELLREGMKVEVTYIEIHDVGRAAFAVRELEPGADVEH